MRSRNIKPGFFQSEILGKLDPLARLLFIGLWGLADREGRLEDRPERIRAMVLLPYDQGFDVHKLLDSLHEVGVILRYELSSNKYLWVINFRRHQNPHFKEKSSVIPPPENVPDILRLEPGQYRERSGKASASRADSLISDFPIPDTRRLDGGSSAHAELTHGSTNARACATELTADTGFEEFISDWPHQVNLMRARRLWNDIFDRSSDRASLGRDILAGKARYQASDQWARGVYDAPDKWLLNEKWKDYPARKKTTEFNWADLKQGEDQ